MIGYKCQGKRAVKGNTMYEVRQPIANDYNLDREAYTISKHRTIEGAQRSLERRWKHAIRQGGFSQDFIWDTKTESRYQGQED